MTTTKKNNNKFRWSTLFILLFYTIAFLITLSIATAYHTTINDTNGEWKHVGNDLVVTISSTYTLDYWSSNGYEKTINTSPYTALSFMRGVNSDAFPHNLYILDASGEEIVVADYTGGDIDTANITGELPTYYNGNIQLNAMVDDTYGLTALITYAYDSNNNQAGWKIRNIGGTANGTGSTAICMSYTGAWGSSCGNPIYVCGESIQEYIGYGLTRIYQAKYAYCSSDPKPSLIVSGFEYSDDTHALSTLGSNSLTYWGLSGTSGLPYRGTYGYDEGSGIVVCRGQGAYCYSYDKDTLTRTHLSSIVYDEGIVYPSLMDDNGYDKIYVDTSGNLRLANGGTLTNVSLSVGAQSQFQTIILDGAVIYDGNQFATFDELTSEYQPEIENATTYYNITTLTNETFDELYTLELIGGEEAIIGYDDNGNEKIALIDYSDTNNIVYSDTVTVGNALYETSTNNTNVMVGTSNGIYTYDLATLTEQYQDEWGIFHSDDAYSIKTLNDTTAYVCDNNDEPDYYVVDDNPIGNLGTGCYDIEKTSDNYIAVDIDDEGIILIDISDPENPNITSVMNDRTSSHGYTHGDLIDIKDDQLVAITNPIEFTIYDITDKENPDKITVCSSGGVGLINSVELLTTEIAIAGTNNGRLLICNISNTDKTSNTEWRTINGMNSEPVKNIEYDFEQDQIHAIGTTMYVIMEYTVETIPTNQPPTIQSYSVSDYELLLNQPVTIDIVAGNVDPEDVIRYGFKCKDTWIDYVPNMEGSYTCEYNESGTYNIVIAVSDNYHATNWYDETSIPIEVLPVNFTGGIIRVIVYDYNTDELLYGALVEADNVSTTTDIEGRATLTVSNTGAFPTTFTKSGYYTTVKSLTANGNLNYVTMNPLTGSGQTGLTVTVLDDNQNPLEGAMVSYINTITYLFDYKWTDANGNALFINIDSGNIIVQASKDGFDQVDSSATLSSGMNYVTIELPLLSPEYLGNLHEDRNCVDNGIWLCGTSSQIEHTCNSDDDCLSDFCTPGVNTCSRFNYSVCDANDMARDQRCVVKYTFEGGMNQTTNFMLSNLLWVIIVVIIMVLAGIIFVSWNR